MFGWQPSEIDELYWDDAVSYGEMAADDERTHYRMLLDIAAAAQSSQGYKQLRRDLTTGGKAKTYTPLTMDEAVKKARELVDKDGV